MNAVGSITDLDLASAKTDSKSHPRFDGLATFQSWCVLQTVLCKPNRSNPEPRIRGLPSRPVDPENTSISRNFHY